MGLFPAVTCPGVTFKTLQNEASRVWVLSSKSTKVPDHRLIRDSTWPQSESPVKKPGPRKQVVIRAPFAYPFGSTVRDTHKLCHRTSVLNKLLVKIISWNTPGLIKRWPKICPGLTVCELEFVNKVCRDPLTKSIVTENFICAWHVAHIKIETWIGSELYVLTIIVQI